MKAMIAGNNVCADRYLGLVEKFGADFVEAAGRRMIEDSEAKARAKLRSLPDGTWVSREYVTTLDRKSRTAVAQQLYCTMTKKGDELEFDLEGTSRRPTRTTIPPSPAPRRISPWRSPTRCSGTCRGATAR